MCPKTFNYKSSGEQKTKVFCFSRCSCFGRPLRVFVLAVVAQLVEHDIGNIEVIGSIPINGSLMKPNPFLLLTVCVGGGVYLRDY